MQTNQQPNQPSGDVRLVRPPYWTEFIVCTCKAIYKDDCVCIRAAIRSKIATASSGVALSSKTD